MRFIVLALFCFSSVFTNAQTYRIQDIPDSLKENANAVFILDEASHEISNLNKAIYKAHYVVAIFNDKGEYFSREQVGYGSNSKILSFDGKVYDQFGKLIKKTKKSDIYDRSYADGFSIYDYRVQTIILEQNSFPYIVEFSYEIQYDQTYSISDWYVNSNENVSVVKSKYSISAPTDLEPNFLFENTDRNFERTEKDGAVVNSIEFNHLPAREREPYGPYLSRVTPVIRISPSKFSYEKFDGDFTSWESIGKWQLELNQGRDKLSENTITEIKTLVSNLQNQEDKIKAVYEYMQDRTRYVSIQLGIGGFQPFPASTVEELGYGDCKALSNYTKSLLNVVGIESYYTWVHGGSNPDAVYNNFAYDSFNHIILCVPVEQDTVWLECTSQSNPYGYQGDFTGDRDVLVITPEGGKVGHTTVYRKEDNFQKTTAIVNLSESGSAQASFEISYSGLQHENGNLNWVIDDGEEELKKWIYKNTKVSDFHINNFEFNYQKAKVPVITEQVDIEIQSLASRSGDRVFLKPNLLNRWERSPRKVDNRQTDVILKTSYVDSDSIVYQIPANLEVEYLPEDVMIETEFGKYEAQLSFDDNILTYVRKIEIQSGRFDSDKYGDFRDFYKSVVKADKSKVVFVTK